MIVRTAAVLILLVLLASCGTPAERGTGPRDLGPVVIEWSSAVPVVTTTSSPPIVVSITETWGDRLMGQQWGYDCGNVWKFKDGTCRRGVEALEQMLGEVVEESKRRGESYADILEVARKYRLAAGNWLARCGPSGEYTDWPVGCLSLDTDGLRDAGIKIMVVVRRVER